MIIWVNILIFFNYFNILLIENFGENLLSKSISNEDNNFNFGEDVFFNNDSVPNDNQGIIYIYFLL